MHNSTQCETSCTYCMMIMFVFHTRQGPDMSGDNEKIFHRSLDVLHFWITDCRLVDFMPKPSLVDTLENFLNTEVTTCAYTLLCTPQTWHGSSRLLPLVAVSALATCTLHRLLIAINLAAAGSIRLPVCQHILQVKTPPDTECVEQQK